MLCREAPERFITLLVLFPLQLDETVEALLRHHENQGELSSGTEVAGTQEGPTRDETPLTEPGTSELRGRARALGSRELNEVPGEVLRGGDLNIRLRNPCVPSHTGTQN